MPFETLSGAPPEGPCPALITPNRAAGSLGITKDAVVRSPEEARACLDCYIQALPGRDALFQEYLTGTGYGIGLIGNPDHDLEALPALEVDFSGLPAGLNPIFYPCIQGHAGLPLLDRHRLPAGRRDRR